VISAKALFNLPDAVLDLPESLKAIVYMSGILIYSSYLEMLLMRYFRTEENLANREIVTFHNPSKLAVHATFWLLNAIKSDTFILDPLTLLLEPGQKQVG